MAILRERTAAVSSTCHTVNTHTWHLDFQMGVVCVCFRSMYPLTVHFFYKHMISQISSSAHWQSPFARFLPCFLPFFFSLMGSVYVSLLNTSPFSQGGDRHFSRLTTSPTFPLHPPFNPRSPIYDIYYETFTDLSLQGHLQWLHTAFQTIYEDHQGIKLSNCHHIL